MRNSHILANKHRPIEDIFRRKGHAVISHNRSTTLPEGNPGCNSSGIILGISRDIPGGLSNICKDTNGRAIAASIPFSDASTIRVVAIYGPTAAMTRRFPHTPHGTREERDLVAFITTEYESALQAEIPLLVMGDFNSFSSLTLDRTGGEFYLRPGCVSASMLALGGIDTFRYRHPTLRGYSYIHNNGTATRLDQIWLFPTIDHPLDILNAALVNDARHKRDHLLPLLDIGASIPTIILPSSPSPG